jgi:hypothetical protein
MNTQNYLSLRRHQSTQQAHDRALLRTLLVLIAICLLCALVDKTYGQSVASTTPTPAATTVNPGPVKPAPAPTSTSTPSPTPSPYQPTPEQAKDLRIAQLEAITAQQAWSSAAMKLPEYQAYDRAVNNIGAVCQKIKLDNKWPSDVACDINRNPIVFGKIVFGKPESLAAVAATK